MTENVGPDAQATAGLYADDTLGITSATSWDSIDEGMTVIADNLATYSNCNGLILNKNKTQTLRLGHKDTSPCETLNVLGVEINRTGGFSNHHANMLTNLKQRTGAIRRLTTVMPRGKLHTEIARSLVVGKLQVASWITREARLEPRNPSSDDIAAQRVMNSLGRTLLGVKRSDRYRVTDLVDRANLPTVNQIVVKGAALAAWKAQNGGPLADLLEDFDGRTRGCANNLTKPASSRCIAAKNLADVWNHCEALRQAKTIHEAKREAAKLATKVRHL